jgi:hypothetical protein
MLSHYGSDMRGLASRKPMVRGSAPSPHRRPDGVLEASSRPGTRIHLERDGRDLRIARQIRVPAKPGCSRCCR